MDTYNTKRGWISGAFPAMRPLDVNKPHLFITLEKVQYATDRLTRATYSPIITAEKGFVTDLASVPSFLPLALHSNRLSGPAIIHDWLYGKPSCYQGTTRKIADLIFRDAMIDNGVRKITAYTYYSFVRVFGWRYYADA